MIETVLQIALGVFIGNIATRIVWKWGDDLYRVTANRIYRKMGWKLFMVRSK